MAPQPTEADIIFNRANVALAKSQRLVASWLPPRTEDEIKNAKTEEEIEKEEQELFTPVPELLGLGAKPPEIIKDGDPKRQKLSSNDVLRRQLLGKDHAKLRSKIEQRGVVPGGSGGTMLVGSNPRPAPAKRKLEDESSGDEGGRSSLGKKKLRSTNAREEKKEVEAETMRPPDHEQEPQEPKRNAKVGGSYLDEVLSQKEKKRREKRKKKNRAAHVGKAIA
ncbi:MAG: hypothetical protein Q9170_002453 [Blastenia crenularia]